MAGQVVNNVTVAVTAEAEGLRTQLQVAEGYIKQLEGTTKASGAAATVTGQKYGQAAIKITSVGEAAARAGELGAQGAKQLITSAAGVAFAFGPQGALIGAVGIATLAIVQLFARSSEAAKRAKKDIEDLDDARRSRAERADPTLVPRERKASAQAEIDRLTRQANDAIAAGGPETASGARVDNQAVVSKLLADRAKQVQNLAEANLELAEAQKQVAESAQAVIDKEAQALGSLLASGKASNAERERARQLIAATTAELARLAAAGTADAESIARRAQLTERLATLTKSQQGAAKDAAADAKARQKLELDAVNKALDDQVAARKRANDRIFQAQRDATTKLAEMAGDTVKVLKTQIEETVAEFKALGASDAEIARIVAPLEAALAAAEGLRGAAGRIELPKSLAKDVADSAAALKEAERQAKDYEQRMQEARAATTRVADAIADIGNALFSVAGALGIVDDKTQSIARGAINIGTGIAKGNALQILTGVGDLVSGLKGDPAADERHKENLAALRAIEKHTGDLAGKAITGGQSSDASRGVRAVLSQGRVDIGPNGPEIRGSSEILRGLGLDMADLVAVAQQFGITLDGTLQSWVAFAIALERADLEAFTQTFEGQMARLEAELRLEGITDPLEIAIRKIRVLAENSSAIKDAVGDPERLRTAEGREAVITALEDKVRQALEGNLSLEERRGLSVDQFIEQTLSAIEALRGFRTELLNQADLPGKVGSSRDKRASVRQQKLDAADRDIELRDIEDPLEQFGIKFGAFLEAFPGLTEFASQFDLTTVEGIEAFSAALPGFIAGIEDGSIVIEGLAREDIPALVSGLVGLESAGDAAARAIKALDQQLRDAFNDIDLDQIIFGGTDEDVTEKKLDKLFPKPNVRSPRGLPIPQIPAGLLPTFDLSTKEGREAAITALRELAVRDPALKPIIAQLIQDIQRLPEIVGDAVGDATANAIGAAGGGTTQTGSLQTMTLYQGDRLITLEETQLLHLRSIDENTRRAIGAVTAPVSPIVAPSIPGFGASFASGGAAQRSSVQIGPIIVQVPPGTTDPQAFGEQAGEALLNKLLGDALIHERFIAGSSAVI
jgi:hypothetical protein